MTSLPSPHFKGALDELISDWRGQDEIFYHNRAIQTIAWYVGKVKSLVEIGEFKKKASRRQFIAAACEAYGVKERRIYEALEVYQRFAKSGDSVLENVRANLSGSRRMEQSLAS